MGHGDELAIVDANFPAESQDRQVVRLDGVDAPRALEAVLSLVPLDQFVEYPLTVMQVVGDPDQIPETVRDFARVAEKSEGQPVRIARIERHAFYARARQCFAIVITGERRLYGNVIVTKGVIHPPRVA